MRALAALLALVLPLAAGAAEPYGPDDHGPDWQNWALNCQGCHRPDGSGSIGGAPPLAGFVARFLAVPGGRGYLMRVPGVATSTLGDRELASLLNWMLKRYDPAHLDPAMPPYTPGEVAAARRAPLRTDAPRLRRSFVAAMP